MTSAESINKERLFKSLDRCDIHLERMQSAEKRLQDHFPLNEDGYKALGEMDVAVIDQLIFRFSKLQDEMGTNTFRFLLIYLQEDIDEKPFKDVLNKLERLGILPSADVWIKLRELRNSLAHDYPTMVLETIEKLNHFWTELAVIVSIVDRIKACLNQNS
jgi:hypothetical protein